ncbi:flippase-like domain-containing protein [Natronorubrum sp. JWXQ-INN-674]|uniref:Flippase-like domain-containing protein n=1 Tax=Natronorubrum halalkaliphilum TaxID=2691917 RepID=A0A6B0VRH8_9EURY|nr:lysylphosphatidylglycerol synthase transmembrane domain-containing protein [Natronorubrum halalkaliphilum]MXV64260.1 flippase-like domain-containing protein [Natronorubrum halalkaliphilum]
MKRRIVLGFVFALALLALLISVIGSQDILDELSKADLRILSLGFFSGFLALTFRGLVWDRFLSLIDRSMSRRRIAGVFLTAMFVKYATPYGQLATEPFVAYLVSRDGEMAYEDGLASILSADLLNYIPYYSFGFVALALIAGGDLLGNGMRNQVAAFAGLFIVVASIVFIAVRRPSIVYRLVLAITSVVRRIVGRFTGRFDDQLSPDPVRRRLDGFYSTVETITSDKRTLIVATVYAHLGMAFLMLPVYIGAIALGYRVTVPVVIAVVALGKLGSVVPAPGGTGGVEAIVTAGLTTLGQLDPAAALTVALIYRACTYWLTIGIGGLSAAGLFATKP